LNIGVRYMGKSLRAVDLFNGWPVGDEIVKRRYVRILSVLLMIRLQNLFCDI